MEEYRIVARLDDLVEGQGKLVIFDKEDVALFRIGNQVYAVENTCPHQGASLAEGWLEEETVSCPWHAWCFDLRTGRMTLGDYARIAVYRVMIRDGDVLLAAPQRGNEADSA